MRERVRRGDLTPKFDAVGMLGNKGFCELGWGPVSQAAVGSLRVVVPSPALDEHLRFQQGIEQFPIEQLIAEVG